MKLKSKQQRWQRGLTLPEMIVSLTVFALLGGVFLEVLNSGLILFAKNTAVNAAHQEARDGINRLTRDIHAAVSVPWLHDDSFVPTDSSSYNAYNSDKTFKGFVSSTPVNGVAPTAAGVSFQVVSSGPNYVWKDPNNSSLILVADGNKLPAVGQRLLVPFWNVEGNVIKANGSSPVSHSNIWLDNDQQTNIASKGPPFKESKDWTAGTVFAITFYTERVLYLVEKGSYVPDPQGYWRLSNGRYVPAGSYVEATNGEYVLSRGAYKPWSSSSTGKRYNYAVPAGTTRYRYENGELNLYYQRYNGTAFFWIKIATVAKYVSSPQPFYVPVVGTRGVDSKYVGVSLSTRDPKSSNRGYLATSALLDTEIDYRSRIALYQ